MASLKKKLAFVSNRLRGIHSGKYKPREEQIAEAMSRGNIKRAEKLSKHHLGESARSDNEKDDLYADSTLLLDKENNAYKLSYAGTRGDIFQEQALAYFYTEGTSFDSVLSAKCAKIYSMIRKGKLGDPKNVLENIDSKYGLDISSNNPEGLSPLYRIPWEYNIKYLRTLANPKRKSQTGDAGVALTILYSAFKRRDNLSKEQGRSLESALSSTVAIVSLAGSIFFLSTNMTGKVVTNFTQNTNNFVGVCLFCLGIVAGFFYFRGKKR